MKASLLLLVFVSLILASSLLVVVDAEDKILGHRTNFPNAWKLGEVAADTDKLTFLIALKQQNLDVLEDTFWSVSSPDSPDYRNFKTIEEILAIVAPPKDDVEKVTEWLVASGVSEKRIKNFGDALEVYSTVAVARKLFNTEFYYFVHETGKTITRQFGQFSVPSSVSPFVDFVSGLSEFPIPRYSLKPSPDAAVTIAPQSLQVLYKIPATESVTGNSSIGVMEWEDQYFSPSDLDSFASKFAVKVKNPTPAHIVGSNDPSSPQLEATLDIQYALGVAINAEGWFWIEKNGAWLYGWATHFFATTQVPLIVSISYGWNEEAQCEAGIGSIECSQLGVNSQGYVLRVNAEFQKIGLRGISILTASGDSGANGRTDPYCSENHLNPPYPAASPFVTAVGGTEITDASGESKLPNPPSGCSGENCCSGGVETSVSFNQAHYSSGGGFSVYSVRPAYQAAVVAKYVASGVPLPPASYYNAKGRAFPDVSALGSAILIYQDRIETVGGTSASCPIFAGVIALLNQYVISKTGKPLGFLNPFLYKMAADQPTTFHDITVGNNVCTEGGCSANCKGFQATVGWDPVSGLGSPVYSQMKAYVQKLLNIED